MASPQIISQTFVSKLLTEDKTLYPYSKDKLGYFCLAIIDGYKEYDKHKNEVAGHKKIEDFAKEIILIHNKKFLGLTSDDKANYFKQPHYINKIIKDYLGSLISKNNPNHVFTFVNRHDDARVDQLKEIINGYYWLINAIPASDVKKTYLKRLLNQMISGVRLLSSDLYSDSIIIWRSLIESVCYYKVLKVSDEKTENLFITRRDNATKIIGLVPTSKAELVSISSEIENRKMGKSASWWEKQRFSWAKKIINKSDPSVKLLMEKVNLVKYYPHYQVASIFTHEYLIDEADFKEISFMDYLINLYWGAFEEIREELKLQFELNDNQLVTIKKHEEAIRKLLKTSREKFNSFSQMISD